MKNIDKMIKCRAIFLYDVALILSDNVLIDENFTELLDGFFENYINQLFDLFNLIYYFKYDEDNQLYIYEDDNWLDPLCNCLDSLNNVSTANNVYVGINDVELDGISKLAELFCEYVMVFDDEIIRRRG